ncbi:MAG TPA: Fe-S cluster assembly protein SufD [Gammaproteobacteria bacterium]|nr:Fe-S cluster assembly protein SufD [Gammaproteobacteria bacterium]
MAALLDTLAREFRVDADAPFAPLRARAFANARRRGLPSPREEDWKYTDLAGLTLAATRPASPSSEHAALPLIAGDGPRLVFVDGRYSAALSSPISEAGLTVRPLSAMLAEQPAALASLFERGAADDAPVFDALNAAFVEDGALIEVAADAAIARPLTVLFLYEGAEARGHIASVIKVRVGARSRLELVEVHYGREAATNLTNASTDIEAAAGSELTHYRLTAEAAQANHIGSVRLRAARDAALSSYSFVFGGRLTRIDVRAALAEPGARVTLNGLFVAGAGQHIDHQTFIDHQAAHTVSEELYKGLADGDGRGVFRGQVLVRPGAQKISAQQASHNLLLSPTAEIDTKPELEIYADDVVCTHGATVGQIDEAAVFYLQSRGIPAAEARALLTFGFAQAVVEQVQFAPLRAWLTAALAGRADVPLPTPVEESP